MSTLHLHEPKGLIRSSRTVGNPRRYARDVLRCIAGIQAALAAQGPGPQRPWVRPWPAD